MLSFIKYSSEQIHADLNKIFFVMTTQQSGQHSKQPNRKTETMKYLNHVKRTLKSQSSKIILLPEKAC